MTQHRSSSLSTAAKTLPLIVAALMQPFREFFTAPVWSHLLILIAGMVLSPGVGDSYDNALAETINGLYKAEVIWRRGPWRSFEQVEFAKLEWVDWFNNRRLLEPIGNIPPAEAEARYYARLDEPAIAA